MKVFSLTPGRSCRCKRAAFGTDCETFKANCGGAARAGTRRRLAFLRRRCGKRIFVTGETNFACVVAGRFEAKRCVKRIPDVRRHAGRALWRLTMNQETKLHNAEPKAAPTDSTLRYQSGFGNYFVSEAVPGALPAGRNSPQRPPHGLYAELISGTSFTTPRGENRRTWTYRIQPSVVHRPYARIDNGLIRSAPFDDVDATPTQLRWSPIPIPKKPTDFIEGMVTMGGNGDVATQVGM